MAAVSAPGGRRSLLGMAVSAAAARAKARGRSSRLAKAVAIAREHVMTAAALASMDVGAFHWGTGVGWVVTGVSVLALDFAVTG